MEEKKFDIQSLIGFLLIGAILIWMLYNNSLESETVNEPQTTEQIQTPVASSPAVAEESEVSADSLELVKAQRELGAFGYSATLPSATDNSTTISNDLLELTIDNKGGYISEARLMQYKRYDSIPVYLIKDGNATFNLNFTTTDGRVLETDNLYFEPSLHLSGGDKVLSMMLKVSESEFLEYRHVLKPGEYMLDFSSHSQVLNRVFN